MGFDVRRMLLLDIWSEHEGEEDDDGFWEEKQHMEEWKAAAAAGVGILSSEMELRGVKKWNNSSFLITFLSTLSHS